jgi:hypothetical protein
MFALVITGPPGAGKSDVLVALSDLLTADDVRHGALEVEALTSTHPALDDAHWSGPLRVICELYRRFGYERLLVTVTAETKRDLDAMITATGAAEHAVVRSQADRAVLRERLIAREPDGWSGLAELLTGSGRMARSMPSLVAFRSRWAPPDNVRRRSLSGSLTDLRGISPTQTGDQRRWTPVSPRAVSAA